MKETKQFFGQDNRLNKGYSEVGLKESDKTFYRKRFENIFPPVDVIEAFENMHTGSADRIIQLAEQEQIHRQNMEKATLAVYERTKRLGLFFALLTVLIIGYVSLELFKLNKNQEAIIFFTIAYATIFGVSFLAYIKSNKVRENREKRNLPSNTSNAPAYNPRTKKNFHHKGNNSTNNNTSNTKRRRYN